MCRSGGLLRFSDHDGDPFAVLSEAIVAISLGTVNGPARDGDSLMVTLIHLKNGGPLMARQSFEDVLAAWESARTGQHAPEQPMAVYRGVFPLVVHQHQELLP